MLAQISLTPTEGKKIIGIATARLPEVQNAWQNGTITIHPSSSTWFLFEELTGFPPSKERVWVCGVITSNGACVENNITFHSEKKEDSEIKQHPSPTGFRHSWVLKKGEVIYDYPLGDIISEMGQGDLYIKGVNAVDHEKNVGVLAGHPVEGGTFGFVLEKAKENNFSMVYPAGLEKLVPQPVHQVSKFAKRNEYSYSMGISCCLVATDQGKTITELEAFKIISGVNAYCISSGGFEEARGAVTLVLEGTEEQVKTAVETAEKVKGAQLPGITTPGCVNCMAKENKLCFHPVKGKPWYREIKNK